MNPKNFPSLELCKQVSHLFKDTEYWWYRNKILNKYYISERFAIVKDDECECICPAPTIIELLEVLPETVKGYIRSYLCIERLGLFEVGYCVDNKLVTKPFESKSLPNALASMIIYLDQQGMLKEIKK